MYAVLAALWDGNEVSFFFFIGTGFAVNSEMLVTNGHIIDGLREIDDELDAHNRTYGTNLWSDWIVVQNLMTDCIRIFSRLDTIHITTDGIVMILNRPT